MSCDKNHIPKYSNMQLFYIKYVKNTDTKKTGELWIIILIKILNSDILK